MVMQEQKQGKDATHPAKDASVVMMGFRPSFLRFLFTAASVAAILLPLLVPFPLPLPLAPAIMGGDAASATSVAPTMAPG